MQITTLIAPLVVGLDEVGRGCGAGPLMACAFVFLESCDIKLKDSKELSPTKRESLFKTLSNLRQNNKAHWSLISISSSEIDDHGIQCANITAMHQSATNLVQTLMQNGSSDFEIVADGNLRIPDVNISNKTIPIHSIVKADKTHPVVSAASIIAKVIRDRYMDILHSKIPQYSWDKNKGYLTKDHCSGISQFGLSLYHRKSFCSNLIGATGGPK